ncbi:MAG: endolytic transglycosylase MltG [Candidatus Pacebacteria bacterium]|nr:endolytic transglycosylase MltG [Candidatus Paceibacterota bacterium]
MDNEKYTYQINNFWKLKVKTVLNIFFGLCGILIISYYLFSAPVNTSNNKDLIIHVSQNDSLSNISENLKNKKIIKSEFLLKAFIVLFNSDKEIAQGDYLLSKKSPVFSIAWQLAHGKHKTNPIKITLREGLTNDQMANIFADKLSLFRRDLFIEKTNGKQGYLFPDTYFFFPMDTASEIYDKISNNFIKQTRKIKEEALVLGKDFDEIIVMASIIEGEASGKEDAHIISGILWKRIKIGMPLQVDVEKETYQKRGLPDKPINNPGLASIKAALYPEDSPYLYYLHSKSGQVYFAKNLNEHNQNIQKYLK